MVENLSISADWVIHRVPLDVWRHMFNFVHQESPISTLPDINDIVRLSHVCSSWRDIVTNAPELWTRVYITIDPHKPLVKPRIELLSLILRNARDMPLIMSFNAHGFWHVNLDLILEIAKLFFRAAKHAKHLAWAVPDEFPLHELVAEIQEGPLLQSLSINLPYRVDHIITVASKLWDPAPYSLKSLTLCGTRLNLQTFDKFETLHLPFRQLTALDIGSELDIETFCRLASLTPSLATAALPAMIGGPSKTRHVKAMELLRLEELTLRGDKEEYRSYSTTPLLPYIVSPSLTSLRLVDGHSWSPGSFNSFLENSSPRIEHIVLDVARFNEDQKIDCLRLLPFLRTLDFRGKASNMSINTIGSEFCAAMQERDESTGAFVLCPKLEKLCIDHDTLYDPISTDFADMLEDRWRQSRAASQTFKLEIVTHKDQRLFGNEPRMYSTLIRILMLKRSGMDVQMEPGNWLVNLFD